MTEPEIAFSCYDDGMTTPGSKYGTPLAVAFNAMIERIQFGRNQLAAAELRFEAAPLNDEAEAEYWYCQIRIARKRITRCTKAMYRIAIAMHNDPSDIAAYARFEGPLIHGRRNV